jgi:hypothetical protein
LLDAVVSETSTDHVSQETCGFNCEDGLHGKHGVFLHDEEESFIGQEASLEQGDDFVNLFVCVMFVGFRFLIFLA